MKQDKTSQTGRQADRQTVRRITVTQCGVLWDSTVASLSLSLCQEDRHSSYMWQFSSFVQISIIHSRQYCTVLTLLFLKKMLHLDFLSCVDDVMAAETLFFGSSSMITRF
jgi:hypothetical protein